MIIECCGVSVASYWLGTGWILSPRTGVQHQSRLSLLQRPRTTDRLPGQTYYHMCV